jgi:hypothetical protein
VIEAASKLPSWLSSREAVARVARHLGCTPEAAERQIVDAGKRGRVKARGVIEDQPVSPLPAAWHGATDLAGTTMKPPEVSYEITNLELCLIDLVAGGLLPAPAEKAWWLAAEAIAYLIKGVPLQWEAWQGAGVSPAEIEQAEIDLGEVICAGVPARGQPERFAQTQQIPADNFRPSMIDSVAIPLSVAKVVVDCGGYVTTSPRQRSADYRRPRWQAVEVDSAALRQARARPLTTQAEPTAPPPPITQLDEPSETDPAASPAPKKRSRRKAVYQSSQTVRAYAVLDRLFPDKNYPTKGQIPWPELWDMFCHEYERYEKDNPSKLYTKTNPTKKLPMPSVRTVRRALGWE